jgi:hypothetical protein
MYTITKISETIESDIYDIKIPLSMKDEIINNYKLEPHGPVKEYWINNVKIISNNDGFLFDYFIDENSEIDLDLNILIEKYKKVESHSFNFYDSDIEEEYELYQKKNKEYIVQMKIYEKYLVLELSSENLSEIKNNIL